MSQLSRLERLIKHIGEENVPQKLPTPIAQPESDIEPDETPQKPKQNDSAQEQKTVNWWDAIPTVPQKQHERSENHQPLHSPQPRQLTAQAGSTPDSQEGQTAPLGISFSPLAAVAKFPYKFVERKWMQPLASAFFDNNKIWDREWDVYYIWSEHYPTARPVTFIPERQLHALIDEINEAFPSANIRVTEELRDSGLVINFDDLREYPDLRPCWLGRSTSKAQYLDWTENLNMPYRGDAGSERNLEAFKEKMELATEIAKNKSKAAKEKRQVQNVANRQTMARSLLRAQRYLGMLAKAEDSLLPDIASVTISSMDCNKPSQHPFDQDVVFIAFDVEAYERPPRYVTEVGVATLDPRDLIEQPAGRIGEEWQQFIRVRHFRINEYKSYVNSEFVTGCPDRFEFGQSEFISTHDVAQEVAKCFKPPYSKTSPQSVELTEKRNVVLVGQDVSQDINYLQKIGFNVLNTGNLIDKIDTAELYRVHTKDPNPRSLGNILCEFDLEGCNLHNAGNDAVYTLWAMLAVCVKAASERGSAEESKKHDEVKDKRTEIAVAQAKQRVEDELEGRETPTDDEGGVPLTPGEAKEVRKTNKYDGEEPDRGLYTMKGAVLDV